VTATAIALAESGGRPRAHNPNPPDDSYCLMQVNMLGPLGPARRARFHLRRNTDLYDPGTCMRVSYGISAAGSDWSPWTTYMRGTYLRFLPTARRAQGGR
jgi:Lysozyme like domain